MRLELPAGVEKGSLDSASLLLCLPLRTGATALSSISADKHARLHLLERHTHLLPSLSWLLTGAPEYGELDQRSLHLSTENGNPFSGGRPLLWRTGTWELELAACGTGTPYTVLPKKRGGGIRFATGHGDLEAVSPVFTIHRHHRAVVQVLNQASSHSAPGLTHEVPALGEEVQPLPRGGDQSRLAVGIVYEGPLTLGHGTAALYYLPALRNWQHFRNAFVLKENFKT